MQFIEQTWRWFGPKDPVSLADVRQAGAVGIVSALHHIANGQVWEVDEIQKRKAEINACGLNWSVIESIPVHEDIKKRTGRYRQWIEHYKISLRNVGASGIPVVCYNFMPVLDWTRTDLAYRIEDGSEALRFDMTEVAAFDLFLLKRKNADQFYPSAVLIEAEKWFENASETDKHRLTRNIIAGLPGSEESYTIDDFRNTLADYDGITADILQANLLDFLRDIAPVAEDSGVRLAIHPDDPPFQMFGLPRVVSTTSDLEAVYGAYDSPCNGLCFCTGSLGARAENDLPAMFRQFGSRVNFLHLRQVQLEPNGSFYEANHLEGSHDAYTIMLEIVREQQQREYPIAMRPDHGHRMLDDLQKPVANPGYTAIGRLRGLAELRGLEMGIIRSIFKQKI